MSKYSHRINPVILRAYDIRGVVGETLHTQDAYAIGRALVTLVARELKRDAATLRLAVGYDGRLSSPELENNVVRGIKDAGAEAVRVGLGPSPMLYFAVKKHKLDGGVMVTGSHNPPTHNGFKMLTFSRALFGDDMLRIGELAEAGDLASGTGKETRFEVFEDYLTELAGGFNTPDPKKLKVAWDPGNGAAGDVVAKLVSRLPGQHILINEVVDGTFPAHHPDPTEEKNLQQLIALVKKEGCDVGLAFDGDGDRVGAVDSTGRILWGDQLMMLYAADVLADKPGATVIADVKASQNLFDHVAKLGGKPVIWKTGHSFIKAKIAETGAALAGEMSGHIFFADRYYGYDDGIYAAVRLLNLVAKSAESLDSMVDKLPSSYSTPELRIEVTEERKFHIITEVANRLKSAGTKYSDIDGVRVMTPEGWWLLRASNTQAVLVARAEAASTAALEKLTQNIEAQLAASGVKLILAAGH